MPEEINRRVTDAISDLLFTPSRDADKNLLKEGVPVERIHFVGNIMIDSLARAHDSAHVRRTYEKLGLDVKGYALVTLHRPSNVDDPEAWRRIFTAFEMLNGRVRIVFPLHPRTRRRLAEFGLSERLSRLPHVIISPPFGYLDFLNLEIHARFVITDSGGVQEETTWLGVPCLTLRPNTERPITIDEGTNRLVRYSSRPTELWDGRSAERIARVLVEMVS